MAYKPLPAKMGHLINEILQRKAEVDEFDEPVERTEEDNKPISLEGFLRYEIYPDHRVKDTLTGRYVIFNKHLNFAMYPDNEELDPKTMKPIYVLENARSLFDSLLRQKVPGFTKPFPAYRPPASFLALTPKEARYVEEQKELVKELHILRKALEKATNTILTKMETRQAYVEAQDAYNEAKGNLENFKAEYPFYYKWKPYSEYIEPPKDQAEIDAILLKEIELRKRLELVELEIKELRLRLVGTGVLYLFGHKNEPKFGL